MRKKIVFTVFSLMAFSIQASEMNTSFFNEVEKPPKRMTESQVFSDLPNTKLKWHSVYLLSKDYERDRALKFLNRCIKSDSWFLQSAALKSFAKLYAAEGLEHARNLVLHSDSLIVRTESVSYLKDFGKNKDIKLLFKALMSEENFRGSQSLWIRPKIAKAIIELDPLNIHQSKWSKLTHDSDLFVRKKAEDQISL